MDTFHYRAKDARAALLEGNLQAESRQAALADLEARGLFPLELDVAHEVKGARAQAAHWFGRVNRKEITALTRSLADLLRAGINLDFAFDILAREAARPQVETLVRELKAAVSTGESLSSALRARGELFGELYANLVAAGEEGGFLPEALDRVASFQEKRDALVAKIREAMVYPAILSLVGTGTVLYLLAFFIPRFSQMFADMGASLPGPTLALLAISGFLANWWWLLVLAMAAGLVALTRVLATDKGQLLRDGALLRIPLASSIARLSALARLSRTLGTLAGAGVPMMRSLEIAGKAAGNRVITGALERVADQVKEGAKLGEAMAREDVFPPSFRGRVAVGEESGRLDEILVAMADGYEANVDRAVKAFVTAFEPLLICLLAGIVGFIVVAMLLPIFTLSKAIRQ